MESADNRSARRYLAVVNPLALLALVLLTPLAIGSLYQALTAGLSPISALGLVAWLGVIGAVKRIVDDRREAGTRER